MRVLIADDHRLVHEGVRAALKSDETFEIVGTARFGSQVLPLVNQLRPDVVLLDIRMPEPNGIEVARTIQGRKATDAVDYLMLVPRKSAKLIAKTLKSAIANAENNNNLSADSLRVKSAIIENGPVLKRFKAGARGSAKPRVKPPAE